MTDSISGIPTTGSRGLDGPPVGATETNGAVPPAESHAVAPAPPRPRIGDTRPAAPPPRPAAAPGPVVSPLNPPRPPQVAVRTNGSVDVPVLGGVETERPGGGEEPGAGDDAGPKRSRSRRRGGRTA